MSLDADQIVDRRRMRRKLTFWRVADGAGRHRRGGGRRPCSSAAAAPDRRRHRRLDRAGHHRGPDPRQPGSASRRWSGSAKSSAKAVIVHINSPGGTVAGSEQLHDSLMRSRRKKPLVVVVDGLAASGGYIAAMASDHIIAQQSSLVGSIGVMFQYPNFTDLLKTIGVKVEEIKSSPLKAAPNGFEPTSPEARAAVEALVMDSYDWFKDLVRDRRRLDGGAAATRSPTAACSPAGRRWS